MIKNKFECKENVEMQQANWRSKITPKYVRRLNIKNVKNSTLKTVSANFLFNFLPIDADLEPY